MKTHDLKQGTPEWFAHRARHFNASDAPAMLGCSPYTSRSQLLQQLHTGLPAEVDPATQRRFDEGHRAEALARPLAEEIIGDDLAPVVGSDGKLSASFDGLTLMGDTAFEHKSLNGDLRDAMIDFEGTGNVMLPKHYRVQMEQQLMVSGAARVLFMASSWSGDSLDEERHCWYYPDPALRAEIVAGWAQFAADLAAYAPQESAPAAVAAPIESLPAVSVRMDGALAVVSNLGVFGTALRAFVAKIPARPTTDQEFADADSACKALKKAEEALDGAEANAMGQISSVDELVRSIADLRHVARTARLATEKLVTARKQQIRVEEVQRGKDALAAHIASLNASIGKPYMPAVPADFAAAISGKKNLDSLRNAIDTELARAKIAANEIATRIQTNLAALRDLAKDHAFLFADTATLVLKAPEDCRTAIEARIAAHRQEEERRLVAERERIRAEEAARLQREQEARDRENARQAAEAAKPAPTPAPAATAAPAASSPSATVVRMQTPQESAARILAARLPTAVPATPPTLRLGQINERLAPLQLTADGLRTLGFEPAGKDRAAVLYHEQQFEAICSAVIEHVMNVVQSRLEAA